MEPNSSPHVPLCTCERAHGERVPLLSLLLDTAMLSRQVSPLQWGDREAEQQAKTREGRSATTSSLFKASVPFQAPPGTAPVQLTVRTETQRRRAATAGLAGQLPEQGSIQTTKATQRKTSGFGHVRVQVLGLVTA